MSGYVSSRHSAPPLSGSVRRPTAAQGLCVRRGRRVILLIVLLCLLNAFDLVCTVTVHDLATFHEVNPVARYLLQHPNLLVIFKVGMVAFASTVFFAYRQRKAVEIVCWSVCGAYLLLVVIWKLHLSETAAVISYVSP